MKANLKKDLIKALSETKPETPKPGTLKLEKLKPETIKSEKVKPETLKSEKLKPETLKPKIRVNKKKLKRLRQDFDELRHKFSKKEIDRYRKAFYVAKNKNTFLNQK